MNDPVPPPARTLVQLNTPVEVIGRQFIEKRQVVELTVSPNKVGSAGKYLEVADAEGTIIFQIKSKARSLHRRIFLLDAEGNIMANLRQKSMSMHGTGQIFRGEGEGELLFTAKRSSSAFVKNLQLHIFLPSNKPQEIPDYKIDGSWSENSFVVSLGSSDTLLAEITKLQGMIAVNVAPNVDYAFIATLVVFLGYFEPPPVPNSTSTLLAPQLALLGVCLMCLAGG